MSTRFTRNLLPALALVLAQSAAACELDGLSHGYGPVSALFAGAHRYQSLNGLEDDEPAETIAETPAPPSTSESTPPTPPRSFVAWAKAKSKPAAAGEAPATWVRRSPAAAPSPKPTPPPARQP